MSSGKRCLIGMVVFLFGQVLPTYADSLSPPVVKRPQLVAEFSSWSKVHDEVTPREIKLFVGKVSTLIDEGADVNACDEFGNCPLLFASYWAAWRSDGQHFNDLVALLLAKGANPNIGGERGTPMFFAATGMFNVKLVEILCAAGGSTKSKIMMSDGKEVTPLEMVRDSNRSPTLEIAMKKCALTQQ